MASKATVSRAIRDQTEGDEQMELLIFASRMPESVLAVLQDTDSSEFIVKFLRGSKAAAAVAAGQGVGSAAGAGSLVGAAGEQFHKSVRASAMMAQLRGMRDLPAAGGVLSFGPSGLLLDPKYNSVYIRACYGPLFEELRTSKCKDIIITGTPGIGKSWFLYHLLAQLVALPEPPPYILWEHMTQPDQMRCYDHASGEVWSGKRVIFEAQLEHPKAWYISDGIPPDLSSLARIILITSPRRTIFKEMEKSGARTLYMPLWPLEELLDCRAKMYDNSVPEGLAKRLYDHYGGVARHVLGVPSQASSTATLDVLLQPLIRALDASSPAQVQGGIGGLEAGPEASHRLLHIITTANFGLLHLDFASPWVADAVVAKAMQYGLNGLAALMVGTEGAIRGYLYEQLMHRLLAQGGAFTVVPVCRDTLARAEAEEELQLPSCKLQIFTDVAQILADGIPENVYFVPQQPNFPTVDALLFVGRTLYLLQMTIDKDKTVSATAVTSIITRLGADKLEGLGLRLVFVLPRGIVENFKLRADTKSSAWPPRKGPAKDIRLFLLKGDAEERLQPQQQTGVSRERPAAIAAAARPPPMMVAAAVKRTVPPSSGRVRRVGSQLLASWR